MKKLDTMKPLSLLDLKAVFGGLQAAEPGAKRDKTTTPKAECTCTSLVWVTK